MSKKIYIGAEDVYTVVDYIEATGTQYINTGIVATANTTAKYKYSLNTVKQYGPHILSGSNWFFPFLRSLSGSTFVAHRGGNNVENTVFKGETGVAYEVDAFTNDKVVINGIDCGTVTNGTSSSDSSTLYLMTYGGGPSDSNYTLDGKLYYCQIYESGTLVRDYVPVTNSAGVSGLYDKVSGTFCISDGSGSFTAGTESGDTISINVDKEVKKLYIGIDNVAHKIKKGYIGDESGIARLVFSGVISGADVTVTYTGSYTDEIKTMTDGEYRLLTMTSSGTLTIQEDCSGDVWMIGAGNGGHYGMYGFGGGGGHSSFIKNVTITGKNSIPIVIGAGGAGGIYDLGEDEDGYRISSSAVIGGVSSFGTNSTTKPSSYSSGGCGGGGHSHNEYTMKAGGSGDGLSKYPFEDSSYFTSPLGGGGGGGGMTNNYDEYTIKGGAGGTNGGDGGTTTKLSYGSSSTYGAGGKRGGGRGGSSGGSGSDATYYGAGGGGAGYTENNGRHNVGAEGGTGYQGIVYFRIPI